MGSEMCIRDRPSGDRAWSSARDARAPDQGDGDARGCRLHAAGRICPALARGAPPRRVASRSTDPRPGDVTHRHEPSTVMSGRTERSRPFREWPVHSSCVLRLLRVDPRPNLTGELHRVRKSVRSLHAESKALLEADCTPSCCVSAVSRPHAPLHERCRLQIIRGSKYDCRHREGSAVGAKPGCFTG